MEEGPDVSNKKTFNNLNMKTLFQTKFDLFVEKSILDKTLDKSSFKNLSYAKKKTQSRKNKPKQYFPK